MLNDGSPVQAGPGRYYFDYQIPADAGIGTWKAIWIAQLDGQQVEGVDEFLVLPAEAPAGGSAAAEPPSIGQPAPESDAPHQEPPVRRGNRRRRKSNRGAGQPETDGETAIRKRELKPTRKHREAAEAHPPEPETQDRKASFRRHRLAMWLIAAIGLVTAGLFLPSQGPPARTDTLIADAAAAMEAGDLARARGLYLDVLEALPRNKDAYYNLGLIAQLQGDLEEAEEFYTRAINADRGFHAAIFNLALVKQTAGESAQAVALYQEALKIEPDYAATYLNLSLIYQQAGLAREAGAFAARAIELDPSLEERLNPVTPEQPVPPATPSP